MKLVYFQVGVTKMNWIQLRDRYRPYYTDSIEVYIFDVLPEFKNGGMARLVLEEVFFDMVSIL